MLQLWRRLFSHPAKPPHWNFLFSALKHPDWNRRPSWPHPRCGQQARHFCTSVLWPRTPLSWRQEAHIYPSLDIAFLGGFLVWSKKPRTCITRHRVVEHLSAHEKGQIIPTRSGLLPTSFALTKETAKSFLKSFLSLP